MENEISIAAFSRSDLSLSNGAIPAFFGIIINQTEILQVTRPAKAEKIND